MRGSAAASGLAEQGRYRPLAGIALAIVGIAFILSAPFWQIPSAAGQQVNTLAAYRGIAPLSRELYFLVTVAGYCCLIVSFILLGRQLAKVAHAWLSRPLLVALIAAVLMVTLGVRTFGPGLSQDFFPFHEGEWLVGYPGHYPLIHGYVINELPVAAARALSIDPAHWIGATRFFRFALGLASYGLLPFLFLLLTPRPARAGEDSAFVLLACAVVATLHAFGIAIGEPSMGILQLPVRQLALFIMLLAVLWVVRSASLQPRARLLLFGASGVIALLINIVSLYQWPVFLGLLLVRAWLIRRSAMSVAAVAAISLGGYLMAAVAADLLTGGALMGSLKSVAFYSGSGRVTFADQTPWYNDPGLVAALYSPRSSIQIPLFILAGGLIWVLHGVAGKRREALGAWVQDHSGFLILLAATALATLFATGAAVGGAHVAALAIAAAVAGWLIALGRRIGPEAIPQWGPLMVPLAALCTIVLLGGHLLQTMHALKPAVTQMIEVRAEDRHARDIASLYAARGVSCIASLPSDGGLFYRTGAPSCFSQRLPVYDARPQAQRAMIEELRERRPALIEVAADELDHHYPAHFHVPLLYRFVMANYRPDQLIGGRWFWRLALPGSSGGTSSEHTARPLPSIAIPPLPADVAIDIAPPSGFAVPDGQAGLLVYVDGEPLPDFAAVGSIVNGRIEAHFRPSLRALRSGGELRLWRPGATTLALAQLTPQR